MKFSSIYTIASLAAVGMAAPAIVRREESAAVAELVNADLGALNTLGGQSTTASEAAAPASGNAISPYLITISATVNNLERSSFDKLTSIMLTRSLDNVIRGVYGVTDPNQVAGAQSALGTTFSNLYQDIQSASNILARVTAFVPSNLQQDDVQALTTSIYAAQRIIARTQQVLANANQFLAPSVLKNVQPQIQAIKGSIQGLTNPLSLFASNIVDILPNLNLTTLLASAQNLSRLVAGITQTAVSLPNLANVSNIGNGLALSLNLLLGPKPVTV
ncbi:unnamed protein product [Clonostachys rosea]|uniref:Uncharacterized protein n=1 Tax=Bionectria ochroleuca TaxID=29856 RepID=A0ABY6UMZ4_BIOOC|nr:unnamed protein product [Clonostachys rosea]